MATGPKTHKIKIGPCEYTILSLPAWEGFGMQQRLIGMFGGGVSAVLASATDKLPGIDPNAALSSVAGAMASEEFREIAKRLLAGGFCKQANGVSAEMSEAFCDLHFAENYAAMIRLIWFCLERNFGGFLATAPATGLIRKAKEAVRELSKNHTESPTGDSAT